MAVLRGDGIFCVCKFLKWALHVDLIGHIKGNLVNHQRGRRGLTIKYRFGTSSIFLIGLNSPGVILIAYKTLIIILCDIVGLCFTYCLCLRRLLKFILFFLNPCLWKQTWFWSCKDICWKCLFFQNVLGFWQPQRWADRKSGSLLFAAFVHLLSNSSKPICFCKMLLFGKWVFCDKSSV